MEVMGLWICGTSVAARSLTDILVGSKELAGEAASLQSNATLTQAEQTAGNLQRQRKEARSKPAGSID